jgi:hypothetical protein
MRQIATAFLTLSALAARSGSETKVEFVHGTTLSSEPMSEERRLVAVEVVERRERPPCSRSLASTRNEVRQDFDLTARPRPPILHMSDDVMIRAAVLQYVSCRRKDVCGHDGRRLIGVG